MKAITQRIRDYGQFIKLRLSLLVVFSAVLGYLLAAGPAYSGSVMVWLALGGFLVTGASNGLNQIIERHTDALMHRTLGRPVPSGRMGLAEAWLLALTLGLVGLGVLAWGTTQLSVAMGAVALLSYAFAYTPLKKNNAGGGICGGFPRGDAGFDWLRRPPRPFEFGGRLVVFGPVFLAVSAFLVHCLGLARRLPKGRFSFAADPA